MALSRGIGKSFKFQVGAKIQVKPCTYIRRPRHSLPVANVNLKSSESIRDPRKVPIASDELFLRGYE